ncbi:hypothetical protein [Paraglaciecola marina]|uniref:hypothetical protein n=1 Tax=Paraglaciecola marina TaxID=2500157 RepID=UPI001060146E|nr:hypothetical protein [Paraglaciecola marina]
MRLSAARILSILFVACFLGGQLAYAKDINPESQQPLSYFILEHKPLTISEYSVVPLLKLNSNISATPTFALFKTPWSQQLRALCQHQTDLKPFDYPIQNTPQDYSQLTALQNVSFFVQEAIQSLVSLDFINRYVIFKPLTDEPPASFSYVI